MTVFNKCNKYYGKRKDNNSGTSAERWHWLPKFVKSSWAWLHHRIPHQFGCRFTFTYRVCFLHKFNLQTIILIEYTEHFLFFCFFSLVTYSNSICNPPTAALIKTQLGLWDQNMFTLRKHSSIVQNSAQQDMYTF